ncbi:MAG: hypothetical protein M1814_004974 [Vezdaea aestivalis]|nr:MAG: hypothetical protein M1814_004974 [Vezdaea aestivalis]
MAADMLRAHAVPNGSASSSTKSAKPSFLTLPIETQRLITSYLLMPDLLRFAVVSHYFNELANAEIYRALNIFFDDNDVHDRQPWNDVLAGSLDSMVTSKKQHSKHLKILKFDSPNTGKKGENDYKEFSYNVSCGKFMNTLLVLAMRHATGLESFIWNIRVELSPALLEILQKIPSLQHLHVRLANGIPTWKSSRPPYSPLLSLLPPPAPYQPPPPPPPGISSSSNPFAPPISSSLLYSPPSPPPVIITPSHGVRRPRRRSPSPRSPIVSNRPTIGGFKSLSTLSILDIDDLEYLDDIASTITASWQTLKTLKISLSENLANQSRFRNQPNNTVDESDQDLDDLQAHTPPNVEWSPESEADARRSLQKQSSILAKLLCQSKPEAEEGSKNKSLAIDSESNSGSDSENSDTALGPAVEAKLKSLLEKIGKATKGLDSKNKSNSHATANDMAETWALVLKAAGKYNQAHPKDRRRKPTKVSATSGSLLAIESSKSSSSSNKTGKKVKSKPVKAGTGDPGPSSAATKKKKGNVTVSLPSKDKAAAKLSPALVLDGPLLFDDSTQKSSKKQSNGSDATIADLGINIDFPDVEVDNDADGSALDEPNDLELDPQSSGVSLFNANNGKKDDASAGATNDEPTETSKASDNGAPRDKGKGKAKEDTTAKVNGNEPKTTSETEVSTYVRGTRKLEQLENLALHLVPIRPAILHKTIVLSNLKRITLLNVGSQDSFWSMMTKENRTTPLALENIFTDHVTKVFLTCVKSLRKVTDLLLIEPSRKTPDVVMSLAPPSRVRIEDIRRFALVKHMKTLRRLMLNNKTMPGYQWDLNTRTSRLIAAHGNNLEELSVAMNMDNYHLIVQNFQNLTQLRALHILQLDLRDVCISVQYEVRRCILDALTYLPNPKLQYIAYLEQVDRVQNRVAHTLRLKRSYEALAVKKKARESAVKKAAAVSQTALDELTPPDEQSSADTDADTADKGKVDIKGKGKAKLEPEPEPEPVLPIPKLPLLLPSDSNSDTSLSDSDSFSSNDEDSSVFLNHQLKYDMRSTVFYHINNVKIFQKDIRSGRL